MDLQFINHSAIGREQRRAIRSHVMKGKNAGRPRPPRRRPDAIPTKPIWDQFRPQKCTNLDVAFMGQDPRRSLDLRPLLWNDMTLISFPQQLSSGSSSLLRQAFFIVGEELYPSKFCKKYDITDSVFVHYLLQDEAYFHSILAIATSFLDVFPDKPRNSSRSLRHLSRAYALINQRLSGPDAASDSTIAAVTALVLYQRIHHQQPAGLVHLHGLRRMTQLRGGMAKLGKRNRELAQKAWRVDLEFSLQDGSTPRFRGRETPNRTISKRCIPGPANCAGALLKDLGRRHAMDPKLQTIVFDVIIFSYTLNRRDYNVKLDPSDYHESVTSLLYRLIQFAPLGSPSLSSPLDNLMQLTMLAFMTTLLPEYGLSYFKYDLLASNLRHAHRRSALGKSQDAKDMLWALFVGGISVLADSDDEWLLPSLVEICKQLDLGTWPSVLRILCDCSWVAAVHDARGQAMWKKMGLDF
ncbi:hypothetical protein GQ53DRAFT_836819 [Thozetella sp. PMI_491]|nr:hypothetical protein GQ53DRAFT_836819 [Thozetella sp. PMI_491]